MHQTHECFQVWQQLFVHFCLWNDRKTFGFRFLFEIPSFLNGNNRVNQIFCFLLNSSKILNPNFDFLCIFFLQSLTTRQKSCCLITAPTEPWQFSATTSGRRQRPSSNPWRTFRPKWGVSDSWSSVWRRNCWWFEIQKRIFQNRDCVSVTCWVQVQDLETRSPFLLSDRRPEGTAGAGQVWAEAGQEGGQGQRELGRQAAGVSGADRGHDGKL